MHKGSSTAGEMERKISDLEDRGVELAQSKQQIEMKVLSGLWKIIKQNDIHITRGPEGEGDSAGQKIYLKR